jgi:hypothetical protein
MDQGILGCIERNLHDIDDEWRLRLYDCGSRSLIATVLGDETYLTRALVAVGLVPTPPIRGLTKCRGCGQGALVGSQPTHGHIQRAR